MFLDPLFHPDTRINDGCYMSALELSHCLQPFILTQAWPVKLPPRMASDHQGLFSLLFGLFVGRAGFAPKCVEMCHSRS